MALSDHHNWIDGSWRSARGERSYLQTQRSEGARTALDHRWPESTAEDVREAVEAAAIASPRWLDRSRAARWSALNELAQSLARELDVAAIAADLGLAPQEYAPHASEQELRLMEALEFCREGTRKEGVVAFGAHWSDGAAGVLARLLARLVGGQTAIVWADARAPQASSALARALETSTFPAGLVNVLHGESREGRDALFATPGLAVGRWKAPQRELLQFAERFAPRITEQWELWRCANRSALVCEHDNVEHAARSIVEQAFSRAATLSGQHPGQVARVLCHQRRFSHLCEELRRLLAVDADATRPCRALDDDLERHVLASWTQGMDEGATPIFGEPPAARGRGPASGVGGIVFVNVDPAGALCRSSRPAPVLSLVRVASDEEGRERRAALDQGPRWTPAGSDS